MTLYFQAMIDFEFADDETVWGQLYDELKRRIRSGHYKERSPIPSLIHLVQEFEVARGTVLKATTQLAREGYINPIPGRGTYVLPKERWPQE
ncbi:winged helix-turn-helix domain-containing protein [Streptosporangium roseum]|uniref:winged helix-turn-helix domain-containing protein n=1 Tax=Streptosporangium roseum TaxID=2001 RepID=UPI0005603661|nr:winged helix-turn-helix domain-containing protein [Streptosporangium roseum]